MLVGYARVSTLDQNLDLQRDALTKAGCERLLQVSPTVILVGRMAASASRRL